MVFRPWDSDTITSTINLNEFNPGDCLYRFQKNWETEQQVAIQLRDRQQLEALITCPRWAFHSGSQGKPSQGKLGELWPMLETIVRDEPMNWQAHPAPVSASCLLNPLGRYRRLEYSSSNDGSPVMCRRNSEGQGADLRINRPTLGRTEAQFVHLALIVPLR